MSFLKGGPGERQVRVTGTACYEGESRQTLTPTTLSDLSIKITNDLLPALKE